MDEMERRPLFGGAIDISLPRSFLDVSQFRQVPDHQEVFTSNDASDLSFIFEIVELQTHVRNADAGRYFWQDLAETNASQHHHIISEEEVQCTGLAVTDDTVEYYAVVVVGEQDVAKGNGPIHRVQVDLGIVRLFGVQSELLLSLNRPLTSASVASHDDTVSSSALLASITRSIIIRDWSLFG